MLVVLLIDDDDSFRSALAENLRDDGHEVLEYALPADIPSLESLGSVEVLITDYEMPGSTGLAFADRFHAAHPQVPVFLVTAFPTPSVVAQSAARAFMHLLRKPLDYDDLRKMLPALPPPAL